MNTYVNIETEEYTLANGGVTSKIWVSEYSGVDPNIFVLQEAFDMFDVKTNPRFQTIATPALLLEYPVNEPEFKGGMYRTNHVYLKFDTQSAYTDFMEIADRRIRKLCRNVDMLKNTNNYKTESIRCNTGDIVIEYTDNKELSNCLKITLPEGDNRFLVKRTHNLGMLFLDVCTPEDIILYSENPADNMHRTNRVELCSSAVVLKKVKDKIIELLK